VVFVDNHDNQRGHGGGGLSFNYKAGELYQLANVFMLAWPYGYPKIMSSYQFDRDDQGPPSDANGHTTAVYQNGQAEGCQKGWVCEHRWPIIAAMVEFRNKTHGFDLNSWQSNGANRIAFGRGEQGFVAINRQTDLWQTKLQSQLPPGRYCNLLTPDCKDTVEVDGNGHLNIALPANSALAIVADEP
jgi:alpha-amylase